MDSAAVAFDLVPLPTHGGELVLVRHGESTANAAGIGQGRADYPLSELGRRQAALTGHHLATLGPFDALYTSPLSRAAETAHLIGGALQLVPSEREALVEIDIGVLSGTTMAAAREAHPDAFVAFDAAEAARPRARNRELIPGWEPVERIVARMWNALAAIAADHPGQRVVVVAHGGVINGFLTRLLEGDALDRSWAHPSTNCAITRLALEPTGVRVLALTDDRHLAELRSGRTVFDVPDARESR